MPDIKNQFNQSTFNNPVFNNYGDKKIKKFLGSLPIFPDVFIGRKSKLEEIRENLNNHTENNCLLLVNGDGGIGKTTLASVYYHHYSEKYQHLIWVVAEQGIKNALLGLATSLQLQFEQNTPEEAQIEQVMLVLANLKTPTLLVIDNADTLDDLENAYFSWLRRYPQVHILITSRVNFPDINQVAVDVLEPADAKQLFLEHYPAHQSHEDELLEQILEAVGYNTLVIELLAKNLSNFNDELEQEYSLKNLLEDVTESLLKLSKSEKIRTDYKLQHASTEEIIEAMYDISTLSEAEKSLLSVFAALPAINIPYRDLKELLTDKNKLNKTAKSLAQKGWIDYDDTQQSFKCTVLVAGVARKKNAQNLPQDCKTLISSLTDKLDYDTGGNLISPYQKAITYVYYGEALCSLPTLIRTENLGILMERIGNFYQVYGNIDKALKFFSDYNQLKKELYEEQPTNVGFKNGLAISYEKLGETYTALGDLDKALKFFSDETVLFEELHQEHPTNVGFKNSLAISYSKLGETYTALGDLDKALKFFNNYNQLKKELYEEHPTNVGFKNGLAISYSKLGETYTTLGDLDKALKFFNNYNQLEKELHTSNPSNVNFKNLLAISYQFLGNTYTALGDLEKALKFFNNYNQLEKELYEEQPTNVGFKNGLAISYSKLGGFFRDKMNNPKEAKKYFEQARDLWGELVRDFPAYVEFQKYWGFVNRDLNSF
jgi:tetratricopeptide (TPR) repeat protein